MGDCQAHRSCFRLQAKVLLSMQEGDCDWIGASCTGTLHLQVFAFVPLYCIALYRIFKEKPDYFRLRLLYMLSDYVRSKNVGQIFYRGYIDLYKPGAQ